MPTVFLAVLGSSAGLYTLASLLGGEHAKLVVLALGCETAAFLLLAFSGKYARFQSAKTLRHATPCVRRTHAALVVAGAVAGNCLWITVGVAPFVEPFVGHGVESLIVAGSLTTASLYCCMLGTESFIDSEEVAGARPDSADAQQTRITRSLLAIGGLPYGLCGGMLPHKAQLLMAGFGMCCIAAAIGMYREEWEAFYQAEEAAQGRSGLSGEGPPAQLTH